MLFCFKTNHQPIHIFIALHKSNQTTDEYAELTSNKSIYMIFGGIAQGSLLGKKLEAIILEFTILSHFFFFFQKLVVYGIVLFFLFFVQENFVFDVYVTNYVK